MIFFVGLHNVHDVHRFERAFVSVNRLRERKSDFRANDWVMDSGAFTTIAKHGCYLDGVDKYAAHVRRWGKCGNMLAAVSQDYMCEPDMLKKTGMTVEQHQQLTIQRYRDLLDCDLGGAYLMPVLQGYRADEYRQHIDEYGDLLSDDAWVGVGSVCKRNGSASTIAAVLAAIKRERPDLRLHGFGLKKSSLSVSDVCDRLYSADSMAWSYAERMAGRSANHWSGAARFVEVIERRGVQTVWEF